MTGEYHRGSLVDQYSRLKMMTERDGELPPDVGEQLDTLYREIVAQPVVDLLSALQKARFIEICVTDECDYKEASRLVRQLCLGLDRLLLKGAIAALNAREFDSEDGSPEDPDAISGR